MISQLWQLLHWCSTPWSIATALLFVILITCTVILALLIDQRQPLNALAGAGYDERQEIIEQGDNYIRVLGGEKCNIAGRRIETTGGSIWRRLEPRGFTIPHSQGANVMQPGQCRPAQVFRNEFPEGGLPPGIWELAGFETVRVGNQTQTRTWHTDSFTVLPVGS